MMSFWKWWLALVGYSSPKHRWIWYCGAGCPWLRYLRSSARHRPLAMGPPPTPCQGMGPVPNTLGGGLEVTPRVAGGCGHLRCRNCCVSSSL